MSMQNRKAAMEVAKAHGAIQSLPRKIWLIDPNEYQKKSKKGRQREQKKAKAIRLVRNLYGVQLIPAHHHIADAILLGRYYFNETQR